MVSVRFPASPLGIQAHNQFFYFCSLPNLLQLLYKQPTSRRLIAALIVSAFFSLLFDDSMPIFRLKNRLKASKECTQNES
jgi:hypothetical protein